MKTLLSILTLGLCLASGIAQECGTPKIDSLDAVKQAYYDNNQYLLDLVDSLENCIIRVTELT